MTAFTIERLNELQFNFEVMETHTEFECCDKMISCGSDQEGEAEYATHFTSWVAGYCSAKAEGITIKFGWMATGGTDSYQEAHDFDIDFDINAEFVIFDDVLVDEDDDELPAWEIDIAMRDKFAGGPWVDKVRALLPEVEIDNIDIDENTDMETFTIETDNAPSIRFTGELVASAASSDNTASGSSFSGLAGRWTELRLYRTAGGKFVCSQIGRTRFQGERDRFSAQVCETVAEVIEFFGHRWLAKELYSEAGIDDVINVE